MQESTCSRKSRCTMMPMRARRFSSYEDFFTYYLQQHSDPKNRLLHACGTGIGIAILMGAIMIGRYWLALLWVPVAYGFAWAGHFLIERNEPATWNHPWWSFISDFHMVWLMVSGRLRSRLEAKQEAS